MEFARDHLNKHGWKEGAGLGREEDGIKEAVKVKIKNDTRGVGHDSGAEFTLHWWDHMFNKAASNIHVEATENGVALKKKDPSGKASKKAKTFDNKSMLYSQFVKGATLSDGNYKQEVTEAQESDSDDDEPPQSCLIPSNEAEILKICGGRTGHKGARHGHKMDAKLLRIQKQEEEHLANQKSSYKQTTNENLTRTGMADTSTDEIAGNSDLNSNGGNDNACEKKHKRKKTKNKEKLEVSGNDGISVEHCRRMDPEDDYVIYDGQCRKKAKKSKKRRKERNDDVNNSDLDTISVCENMGSDEPIPRKKKKKKKIEKDETN